MRYTQIYTDYISSNLKNSSGRWKKSRKKFQLLARPRTWWETAMKLLWLKKSSLNRRWNDIARMEWLSVVMAGFWLEWPITILRCSQHIWLDFWWDIIYLLMLQLFAPYICICVYFGFYSVLKEIVSWTLCTNMLAGREYGMHCLWCYALRLWTIYSRHVLVNCVAVVFLHCQCGTFNVWKWFYFICPLKPL